MTEPLRVTLFLDDPEAWIAPWVARLGDLLGGRHDVTLCHDQASMPSGDVCFLLGCTTIVRPEALARHTLNLVVHESDLPAGRGWSPVSWQVAEGRNRIPIVLFQAVDEVDAGPVYLRDTIELDGTELLPEIKARQGDKTIELVRRFLDLWPDVTPEPQQGESSFYRRRTREDDRIDPALPLAESFDRLRAVDNERYPAWFEFRGRRYRLKIDPL